MLVKNFTSRPLYSWWKASSILTENEAVSAPDVVWMLWRRDKCVGNFTAHSLADRQHICGRIRHVEYIIFILSPRAKRSFEYVPKMRLNITAWRVALTVTRWACCSETLVFAFVSSYKQIKFKTSLSSHT